MERKPYRTEWLDTLRALATLGVIIIHVSSPLVNMAFPKNLPFWWIGNVVDSAVRFAVPIFLMLSGTTLLGKDEPAGQFYKKRMLRVLLPFIFWFVIYCVFRWTQLPAKGQPTALFSILKWGFSLFLKEGISKHFWYIYMILFLYLFVPWLGKGVRCLKDSTILSLLFTWIVLTFLLRTIPLNLYSWSGDYATKILGYFLHAGYLLLGFYLSKLGIPTPKIRGGALLLFLLTILLSAGFAYYFSQRAHKVSLSVYSYLGLNTILQSSAVYILFKDSRIKNLYFISLRNLISSYSFGIYLVHILVIGIFFKFGIFWTMGNPLYSLPLVVTLTVMCSLALVWGLRKLPFGRYIAN